VERLLAWYRVTSSVGAVVALVVANAIPLVGVLFLGWNVWSILVLYWLENGIVGVVNVLKMARAEGPDTSDRRAIAQNPVPSSAKAALIPFFVVHYGLFWFVHGIFVFSLPLFTGMFHPGSALGFEGQFPAGDEGLLGLVPGPASVGLDGDAILFGGIALAISHGLSFWWNFLRGGEYRRVSAKGQMFAPYGRLVALHLTIIVGAMAVATTGAPAAAVAILVALKTGLDLGFHLAEHRTAATKTA
jgi:hypothetical protein